MSVWGIQLAIAQYGPFPMPALEWKTMTDEQTPDTTTEEDEEVEEGQLPEEPEPEAPEG